MVITHHLSFVRYCRRIHRLIVACLVIVPGVGHAQQVTISRDKFGVPSVVSDRLPDAMYGLGYGMTLDNAEQMARNFKQARGRRAEVDGPAFLLTDTFLRSLGIEERAISNADTLPAEPKLLIRRFCDGANRALAEQKLRLPAWIQPFTTIDVLSLAQLAQAAFPLQEISSKLLPGIGSNQFAVAPKRSATGHAILSIDPHLTWSGPLLWYEYSVYSRSFNFHGITLCGLPFGTMGHTDHVAWSMTNNNPRLYDFLQVTTNPANPKQYNYHGEWRNFEEISLEMKYRENGALKARVQTVRRTLWGPMVPLRPQAVRLAIPEIPDMFGQVLREMRARSAGEFRSALGTHGLSMWNIVYADTHGHIGYQYNARLPKRNETIDWTKPVSGADPLTKWEGFWSLDALPHAEDPGSGLLVNANTAPWLTTLGTEITPVGWPAYVTSYGTTTRYERLAKLLKSDKSIALGKAKSYATDTSVPFAASAIRSLESAANRGAATAPGQSSGTGMTVGSPEAALKLLANWNSRADVDARGCGLYLYWLRADRQMSDLARSADSGAKWSAQEQALALAALQRASAEIVVDHGRLDVPWGEIHVSQRGAQTAPISGLGYITPGDSTATVTPNFGPFIRGRIVCNGGSSFRMIVDLDPKGIRSWSALPYGNSQDPSNPHYSDQQKMFGRGEYKDTLYSAARIKTGAVGSVRLRTDL